MGGPKEGKYYILPAADPKILVGVDHDGVEEPWTPVVTDGKYNVFTVYLKENGTYILILEDIAGGVQFTQHHHGKVVGSVIPPAYEWSIQGSDGGPYTIAVPHRHDDDDDDIFPTNGWALNSDKPKSPVEIWTLDVSSPLPEQLWNFVPWVNPESK